MYRGTTKEFEEIPGKKIHWPKRDSHPKDSPDCGFDGTLCQTESKLLTFFISLGIYMS